MSNQSISICMILIEYCIGVCLEAHGFVNAVNVAFFPSILVGANERYRNVIIHRFRTE